MSLVRLVPTTLLTAVLFGCGGASDAPPAPAGPGVEITVAPLTLDGVTNASWRLTVVNGAAETVVERTLDADRFGDGRGSVSMVAPCDATENDNTVTIELLALFEGASGDLEIDPASYQNPGPLSRVVTCLDNADVRVAFDIILARQAEQGFFDIAVDFDDLFCSAKLDCQDVDGSPIDLLYNGAQRDQTFVVAMSCTADPSGQAATSLYRDDVVVVCDGGHSVVVNPAAGPGNLAENNGFVHTGGPLLFGAAVYRGEQGLGLGSVYWNVALGWDPSVTAANCRLTTRGTASSGPLPGNSSPANATYPYIDWNVTLTDAAGDVACTQHPVNGTAPGDGVATVYTDTAAPIVFDHGLTGGVAASLNQTSLLSVRRGGTAAATTSSDTLVFSFVFSGPVFGADVADFVLGGTAPIGAVATSISTPGADTSVIELEVTGGALGSITGTVTAALAASNDLVDGEGAPIVIADPLEADESFVLDPTVCADAFPDNAEAGCERGDGTRFAGDSTVAGPMWVLPNDQATSTLWANTADVLLGATSTSDGRTNTDIIAAAAGDYPCADICAALDAAGHDDWFMPSVNELGVLRNNRSAIGGFSGGSYWSSTEVSDSTARDRSMNTGSIFSSDKNFNTRNLRCVRADAIVRSVARTVPIEELQAVVSELTFQVRFSEAVSGVDASDFVATGTTAEVTAVSIVDPTRVNVTIANGDLPGLTGIVGLALDPGHNIVDGGGDRVAEGFEPSTNQTYDIDPTRLCSSDPPPSNEVGCHRGGDGTIYAGNSSEAGPMYVTQFDNGNNPNWSDEPDSLIGSTSTGNGTVNTLAIEAAAGTYPAGEICADLVAFGFDDWFLPARNELSVIRSNRLVIGNFVGGNYWSSTETSAANASSMNFGSGQIFDGDKDFNTYDVRCARADAVIQRFTRQDPSDEVQAQVTELTFRARFSEPVFNVSTDDFLPANTTAVPTSVVQVDDRNFDVTIGGGDLNGITAVVGLQIDPNHDIVDANGDPLVHLYFPTASESLQHRHLASVLDGSAADRRGRLSSWRRHPLRRRLAGPWRHVHPADGHRLQPLLGDDGRGDRRHQQQRRTSQHGDVGSQRQCPPRGRRLHLLSMALATPTGTCQRGTS